MMNIIGNPTVKTITEVGMQHPIILVLATRNQGKTDEIKALLSQFKIDIKNLEDFGPIPPIVEDGDTFEENAYKKASLTARYLGLPALADDSGLVVEALDGAPGIHSARYAGENASDSQLYRKLLQELGDSENRSAKFVCVLSLAVPTGPALTYEASCEGVITHEPAGTGGFGYDPVFFYPPLDKTFAQLTRHEKNKVSHRGKALHEFCSEFDKVMGWLQRHLAPSASSGCMESGL